MGIWGQLSTGSPGYIPDSVKVFLTSFGLEWSWCLDSSAEVHFQGCGPGAACSRDYCGETEPEDPCSHDDSIEVPVTGLEPIAIATGDVDGDGVTDLAVANSGSNNITIIRGASGPGSYALNSPESPAALVSVGFEPVGLALGDVNGDGWEDLVAVLNETLAVSWSMNDTDFATSKYLGLTIGGAPLHPSKVELGDANGDGKADIAVMSTMNNAVYLFFCVGNNELEGPHKFITGDKPVDMVMADLNEDGCSDIVVAGEDSKTVSVLINEFCE